MSLSMWLICGFTGLIHFTESSVYSMRLAGVRTRQIAIALSFITSALLISRLSNMGQAPLMGAMVDAAVESGSSVAVAQLVSDFRLVVFAAFLGTLMGAIVTPTTVRVLAKMVMRFLKNGSLPRTVMSGVLPRHWPVVWACVRLPRISMLSTVRLGTLPKSFLIWNIIVTAIYTIGVLCALLAGAMLPELRATAIQLSGIVNGIATILLATIVDPAGARITDQAMHGDRTDADVKSVVFYLLIGRLLGTLVLAQLLLMPLTHYIMWVTRQIANFLI